MINDRKLYDVSDYRFKLSAPHKHTTGFYRSTDLAHSETMKATVDMPKDASVYLHNLDTGVVLKITRIDERS